MNGNKKLKRSSNKMIAGVCAGIAEYFDIDTSLVRILWVLFTLFGGAGLLAYIVCLVLMPKE
ncbi:MAG: PspC domain-containing protein [Paludibacteraceae bacterium]|jgi:phage shock protein C|nr:PspC domain-containing protein [Paludibacteraceae bacterium]MBN2786686.1 PspC domain-containing protein [Paludibacteraceae bacterium]